MKTKTHTKSALKKFVKNNMRNVIESFGFKVYRKMNFAPGYERIFPEFTYAPWSLDSEFLDIYDKVKGNTMVDKYRCYELWQLVSQCVKLDGVLIEVGAWRGGTGAIICKRSELSGLNRKVYIADTFRGLVKASEKDSFYKGGECDDTSHEIVETLLKENLKLKNFEILPGVFPDETGHLVKENKISFCHIDVDVYNSAKDIVEWVWPKLSVGGMIVFDDYGCSTCDGVVKFVDEERLKHDRIVVHNLNGHAVVIKIK